MTEDPTNNGDYWKYEVDTVQRAGTTGQTKARRHGEVSRPKPTDGDSPNQPHEGNGEGFDADGIPTGI
jgi:hypothetical protein